MLVQAVQNIHRPPSPEVLEQARRRVAFEELLVLQLTLLLRRHIMRCAGGAAASATDGCWLSWVACLDTWPEGQRRSAAGPLRRRLTWRSTAMNCIVREPRQVSNTLLQDPPDKG